MMDNLPEAMRMDPYSQGIASGHQDLFTPFLGQPARMQNVNHHQNKSHAKWNMPEAYNGESIDLGQTVEDATLTVPHSFWTQVILPYYRTDDLNVSWRNWLNDVHYMGKKHTIVLVLDFHVFVSRSHAPPDGVQGGHTEARH